MANTLYDKSRELFLTANLNWATDSIKTILVDTGAYTPNFTTHMFLSDISASARVGPQVLLSGKSTAGGAADANDATFASVTGPSIEAIVLFKDTGVEGTSPLIAYIDTATGLPITPNGGDIIVTWDNGVNRIFRL